MSEPQNLPVPAEKPDLYTVTVDSPNGPDFVPRTGSRNGVQTLRWKFTLKEAYEVRDIYIENIRDSARRTSDEHNLAIYASLIGSCRVERVVEQ